MNPFKSTVRTSGQFYAGLDLILFWHTQQIHFYFTFYLLLCDNEENHNHWIFIICLCHLDHFLLWTVALYGFNFRKRFIVNSKDHHLIFQPLRYAVSVSRHIHMTKKYLCTVGVFCCLTLYNSTGDHTCCFIVWPMASPAYKAQEYSPPAGTIILPSALWHFSPPFFPFSCTHTQQQPGLPLLE